MKIHKNHENLKPINSSSYIRAADEDFMTDEEIADQEVAMDSGEGIVDSIDALEDQVDELTDQLDDIDEDEPTIEMDNNIENHYLAECDRCHGVFISSMIESDQEIESLSGICPICGKDTNQYIKWVIRKVGEYPEL